MSYEIFTDSTANLPNQIIERFKLNVIPVPVIVNGEITYSYEKDGKNDLKVFYDRLRKKESIFRKNHLVRWASSFCSINSSSMAGGNSGSL